MTHYSSSNLYIFLLLKLIIKLVKSDSIRWTVMRTDRTVAMNITGASRALGPYGFCLVDLMLSNPRLDLIALDLISEMGM